MYLTQGVNRALQTTPGDMATVCGDRTRTFAEHGDRIARFAGGLKALGVKSDDRVAILSLNSDRYAEYLLSIPWSDAVLNRVNIGWSPAAIIHSQQDSGTTVRLRLPLATAGGST